MNHTFIKLIFLILTLIFALGICVANHATNNGVNLFDNTIRSAPGISAIQDK